MYEDISQIRGDELEIMRQGVDNRFGLIRINKATKLPIDVSVAELPFAPTWMEIEINRLLKIDAVIVLMSRLVLRSIRKIKEDKKNSSGIAINFTYAANQFEKIQIMSSIIHDMLTPALLIKNDLFWSDSQAYLETQYKCYLAIQYFAERTCDICNYKYNHYLPKLVPSKEVFVIGN